MSRNSRAARSSSSTSSSRLIPLIGFSIGDCLQRYHHGPRAWQSPLCHDALGLGGVGGAGIFVVDLARHVAERDPPYAPVPLGAAMAPRQAGPLFFVRCTAVM